MNRLLTLLQIELQAETIKFEDELEKIINSNKPIDDKVKNTKSILEKMGINEIAKAKLQQMISNTPEDKK